MVRYTDTTLMPFGKHKGVALANVPAQYLLWAYRELNLQPPLKEYIRDNLQALEQEVKRSNRNNAR